MCPAYLQLNPQLNDSKFDKVTNEDFTSYDPPKLPDTKETQLHPDREQ